MINKRQYIAKNKAMTFLHTSTSVHKPLCHTLHIITLGLQYIPTLQCISLHLSFCASDPKTNRKTYMILNDALHYCVPLHQWYLGAYSMVSTLCSMLAFAYGYNKLSKGNQYYICLMFMFKYLVAEVTFTQFLHILILTASQIQQNWQTKQTDIAVFFLTQINTVLWCVHFIFVVVHVYDLTTLISCFISLTSQTSVVPLINKTTSLEFRFSSTYYLVQ